jgi:hypothetical protein
MAATEPLPPALLAKQLPQRRTVIDSNLDIDFFRPAPAEPRLKPGRIAHSRKNTGAGDIRTWSCSGSATPSPPNWSTPLAKSDGVDAPSRRHRSVPRW